MKDLGQSVVHITQEIYQYSSVVGMTVSYP